MMIPVRSGSRVGIFTPAAGVAVVFPLRHDNCCRGGGSRSGLGRGRSRSRSLLATDLCQARSEKAECDNELVRAQVHVDNLFPIPIASRCRAVLLFSCTSLSLR